MAAKDASQQHVSNATSDYSPSAYLAIHPLRQGHLALLALAQQRLPLLVERRVLNIFFVHEDMKAYAVSPEPDPALLCLVVVHAVPYNVGYIIEVANCRHFVRLNVRSRRWQQGKTLRIFGLLFMLLP